MFKNFDNQFSTFDKMCMAQALLQAKKAFNSGEVPVGCVLTFENKIICSNYNQVESKKDATRHAEMQCLQEGCEKLDRWRLEGCTLYITLEPCLMCLGAIINARVSRVVWAADQTRRAEQLHISQLIQAAADLGPALQISRGLMQKDAKDLLQTFFKRRRQNA